MTTADEMRLIDQVYLSYLRHRGVSSLVAKELKLPIDKVRNYVRRLKKRENKQVNLMIASTFMQQVFIGYQQRVTLLNDSYNQLIEKGTLEISLCCHAKVREIVVHKYHSYECTHCNKNCETYNRELGLPMCDYHAAKAKIIELLREEDLSLIESADRLGFTARVEVPSITKDEILTVEGKGFTTDDKDVLKQAKDLSASDRGKLIKGLERLLHSRVIPKADNETNQT